MELKYSDKSSYIKSHPNAFDSLVRKPKKIVPKPIKPVIKTETPKQRPDVLNQPLSTIRELADYLQVNVVTIKRREKEGKIKSIRINSRGDRRYLKEEIQRFIGGI